MTIPNWFKKLLGLVWDLVRGIIYGLIVVSVVFFLTRPEGWPPPIAGKGKETNLSGKFNLFYQDIYDTYSENGVNVKISFTDYKKLRCDSIGFIQIVRTLDLNQRDRFYYPSPQKEERATPDGWYLDRGDDYNSVFYGRTNSNGNDGEPMFTDNVTIRTAGLDSAIIRDYPYRPEDHTYQGIRWQAVTVAACLDSDKDRRGGKYGYYVWSWTVTGRGKVINVKKAIAKATMIDAVDSALSLWNKQPSSLGKINYPPSLPPQLTKK